jgi:hypothetical protein
MLQRRAAASMEASSRKGSMAMLRVAIIGGMSTAATGATVADADR